MKIYNSEEGRFYSLTSEETERMLSECEEKLFVKLNKKLAVKCANRISEKAKQSGGMTRDTARKLRQIENKGNENLKTVYNGLFECGWDSNPEYVRNISLIKKGHEKNLKKLSFNNLKGNKQVKFNQSSGSVYKSKFIQRRRDWDSRSVEWNSKSGIDC